MNPTIQKRCEKYATYLETVSGVPCMVFDCGAMQVVSPAAGRFCRQCGFCNEAETHHHTANQAYIWNGRYICYCPLGLCFAAASVCDENGALAGALIGGPVVLGRTEDTIATLPEPAFAALVKELPVRQPAQLTALSEITGAAAAVAYGPANSKNDAFVVEQQKILDAFYTAGPHIETQRKEGALYPIEYEYELSRLIASNDRASASELLNKLLGQIYMFLNFDLDRIKPRVVELIVVMSRATIDAGADINEIFILNNNFIGRIGQFQSLDDLSAWLTAILNRFISYTFNFSGIQHSDVVYRVMEIIRYRYAEKLSIGEIATEVGLSRSYLSRLFKQQTGQNIVEYIARERVDRSKKMLAAGDTSIAQIALSCGFDDQSYFTKVFKKYTGVSPKTYRDNNIRRYRR